MAAALQRAAEASKNKQPEVTVKAPSAPAKPASLAGSRPNVPLTAASATAPSGSAAAPAPAKEAAPQLPPAVTKASAPVLAPLSMESASAGLSKRESAAVPVPTFGALDGGSKEASEAGGSKKGILIVAAVAVLAIAGYFGYTKMARNRPAKEVAQVQAQAAPAAQVPAAETPSAPTTVVTAANPTQPPRTEAAATTKSLASTTAEDDTPEVVVTHPEPSKMIVMKSGIGSAAPKKKTEEAAVPDVPAPALGMGNEDQSAISNLMTSAPVTVPKVASTSSSSDVLRISQGVTQGLLLKRVQPVYPHPAMQMRLQGAVQLQATINKQGSITSVKVLSGDAILARAAVEAVNQWKYKPYFLNGEPVDIQTQITVNFKLP
jgi:protein TonB